MSDRSTPSQDSVSPDPDTSRGGAIPQGPFPIVLMDIAQCGDADRLLRELDMLKDDALEAAHAAIRATDRALADLWDALRWTAADGSIQALTAVMWAWTPRGLLLTATVTVATSPSYVKVQGSEVPSLGTFSGTLSGEWAKVGKMGENGGK